MILGATLLLAGCDSAADTRPPMVVPNPAALVGTYELWICATADCGPTATTPGTRSGRLQLTAERVPVTATDSAVAYHGCAMIGPLVKVDTTTALTAIRWRPGETAGRVMFAMIDSTTSEYDITLDDLGGMLKGEARWRREGVISDEAPDHVVARRQASSEKIACVAATPASVAPGVKKSVAAPKPARKKG
jgi:hypothetical protein